jgi:nifR3 family TIM-barrel protein
MAGFTDRAFRAVCVELGCVFGYTEMVSAEGLVRNHRQSLELMERAPGESLLGIQVFTGNPDTAARCMAGVLPFNPTVIDLNCGCPVPKVTKTGAGSALMLDPVLLGRVVAAMAGESSVPVTVKLRSGWDHDNISFIEAAMRAEDAGARMVCLHPRTRSQGYAGTANLEHIAELKRRISVPVIGSGDCRSPRDAVAMMETTGCDGVMFARGALGNPFVFAATHRILEGDAEVPEPTTRERIGAAFRQLEYAVQFKGERYAINEMRKHFCTYTRGLPGGAALRKKLVRSSSLAEYRSILQAEIPGIEVVRRP